jgi:integrase
LLGFAGALRRSELVGLDVEHVTWTKDGLKLLIERSKTDTSGEGAEIAIPRGQADDTCRVMALRMWLESSKTSAGPLFRKVNRGGVVEGARLSTDAVRQILLKRAAKARLKGLCSPSQTQSGEPSRQMGTDDRIIAHDLRAVARTEFVAMMAVLSRYKSPPATGVGSHATMTSTRRRAWNTTKRAAGI